MTILHVLRKCKMHIACFIGVYTKALFLFFWQNGSRRVRTHS